MRPPCYTTPVVSRRAGVSFRQLDYWVRIGLVTPSEASGAGPGTPRLWSAQDIVAVGLVGALATCSARLATSWLAAVVQAIQALPLDQLPDLAVVAARDRHHLVPIESISELILCRREVLTVVPLAQFCAQDDPEQLVVTR